MGNIRLYGATSGYTELAPPAVAPDGVLALPSGTGTLATQAYVDTAESDAIAAIGLVRINTTTFSAVSSVSLNNVFTSTYQNYRILFDYVASAQNNHSIRMRVAGTDNTSTNYSKILQGSYVNNTAVTAGNTGNTSWDVLQNASAIYANASMDIYFPAGARSTSFSMAAYLQNSVAEYGLFSAGIHNVNTAYDGFSLIAAAGTISGTIRIYGYKNS